jgi:uncharacterized membrane-anchored protein YhcB (DUF1043 family)
MKHTINKLSMINTAIGETYKAVAISSNGISGTESHEADPLQNLGVENSDEGATSRDRAKSSNSNRIVQLTTEELDELRDQLESSLAATENFVDTLAKSSPALGSNYYWVVFIVMFGGLFLVR